MASSLLALPSSAVPSDEPDAIESTLVPAALPAVGPDDDLPGRNDLPQDKISSAVGTVVNSQGAVVRRSKMYITNGPDNPIWGGAYFAEFNTPVENPTKYVPICTTLPESGPCVPDPFFQPECATQDPATQRMVQYFRSRVYPLSQLEGGGVDVGLMVRTRVKMVAFGSIPATATLTMRAPRVGGQVQPLISHVWSLLEASRNGCDPDFSAPNASALVEGQVTIGISDLSVDGVSVDLGPDCRTVTPVDIQLWGETERGGYGPGSGGPLGAFDGLHPGSIGPLDHPLYYKDRGRVIPASTGVTVPPFTGCGTNGDDLSPLVTAMASGPNNPVRAVQSPLLGWAEIPLDDIAKCQPAPRPGYPDVCPQRPEAPDMPPLPDGETP